MALRLLLLQTSRSNLDETMATLRKNLWTVLALGVLLAFVFAAAPAAAARNNEFKYVTDGDEDIASVVDVIPTDGDEQLLRAYAQWVTITISLVKADKGMTLTIKKADLTWGKWWNCDDKDVEVSAPNEVQITSTDSPRFCACGRSDSPSGVTGSFDIYHDNVKVIHVYFNCPWGSKTNAFTISEANNDFAVTFSGANLDSGALGDVQMRVIPLI